MITEADLNTLITPDVLAVALVGRPPKPTDDMTAQIDGKDQRVNLADIYLVKQSGPFFNLELQADQLALPVGRISDQSRISAKPVISTPRTNSIFIQGGGYGSA